MRATALSTTHPRAASQADDKRFGQLFGCANHYEQERYDELVSMMCSTSSRSRGQTRCKLCATPAPPLARKHRPPCPFPRQASCLTHARKRHASTRTLAACTM